MRNEFEFIDYIKSKYGLNRVGDDCAVLPKDTQTDLLITSDLVVEDIDFRVEWTTPEFLGHKALAVSLSDIAAMGGIPQWALLTISVSEKLWKTDFLDGFYSGWHHLARNHTVELVGGDVSRTKGKLVIDSIVGGTVPEGKAVLRSGANAGEAIVVTGHLGGAAGGLKLLEAGKMHDSNLVAWEQALVRNQLQPSPKCSTGMYLQTHGIASAMLDVSDGVSSDLYHLCAASRVGARIFADKIPVDPNLSHLGLSPHEEFELALNGGDDLGLLFTVAQDKLPEIAPEAGDEHFTVIGEVTGDTGTMELVRGGRPERLMPRGFRHF